MTQALAILFPDDPPHFLLRVPHGYHAPGAIAHDLESGGFAGAATLTTLAARSRAATPRCPAAAYWKRQVVKKREIMAKNKREN